MRFGVVVQSDAFLPRPVVLIAPTSISARHASFRPEVEIEGTAAKVLVEQLVAVDIIRRGDFAGHLTPEEKWCGLGNPCRARTELRTSRRSRETGRVVIGGALVVG